MRFMRSRGQGRIGKIAREGSNHRFAGQGGRRHPVPAPNPAPETPDPHEAAAIVRVQGGDTAAFDLLVRRYMRPAFAVAYRVLGHREDAEDVVQEAFLAALANIRTFDTSR